MFSGKTYKSYGLWVFSSKSKRSTSAVIGKCWSEIFENVEPCSISNKIPVLILEESDMASGYHMWTQSARATLRYGLFPLVYSVYHQELIRNECPKDPNKDKVSVSDLKGSVSPGYSSDAWAEGILQDNGINPIRFAPGNHGVVSGRFSSGFLKVGGYQGVESEHGKKVERALMEDINKIKSSFYEKYIRELKAHVKEAGLPKEETRQLTMLIANRFGGIK